jgi:hypothetical protein
MIIPSELTRGIPIPPRILPTTSRLEKNTSKRGRERPKFVIRTMQYFRDPTVSAEISPEYHKIRARKTGGR